MTGNYKKDLTRLRSDLAVSVNFDVVSRDFDIGGRRAAIIFVDGFCKDAVSQKLFETLTSATAEQVEGLKTSEDFLKKLIPYGEANVEQSIENIETAILSGQLFLIVEGFPKGFIIDLRQYPTRGIVEPDKDRSLRGSRDAFCETLIMNTALIRRRIRDRSLRMEYMEIGESSKTDVAICYLPSVVNKRQLKALRDRLSKLNLKGASMTYESFSEALVPTAFFNPFPRIKYTERPDYTAACILEGRIALIIDNCPSVMLFATCFADFFKEADDYYFPPFAASFVRSCRLLVSFLTVYLTPLVLLLNMYPQKIPPWLEFIKPAEDVIMPLFAQFLVLEFIIDGLKLASINTPSSVSSSLGIIGGLMLSEFAVKAGWFVSDSIVYISFVAIASYAQPSFEMGYSFKFARIFLLILVRLFGIWGIVGGSLGILLMLIFTKTLGGRRYFYPIIPFNLKDFGRLFVRPLQHTEEADN